MSVAQRKAELRTALARLKARLTPGERERLSVSAGALLMRQSVWREAKAVLFFSPLPDELDLWPLAQAALQQAKRVGFPRHNAKADCYEPYQVSDLARNLRPGRYGIPEPVDSRPRLPLNRLDLILVPGVAFDRHGRRLGRGKGYYDRMLRELAGIRCGVAFDEQIVPEVPVAPHDIHLNCIVTPTRWFVAERSVLE